jgi:hypothetical protein
MALARRDTDTDLKYEGLGQRGIDSGFVLCGRARPGYSVHSVSSGSAFHLKGMLLHPTPRLTISEPLLGISNRPRL